MGVSINDESRELSETVERIKVILNEDPALTPENAQAIGELITVVYDQFTGRTRPLTEEEMVDHVSE